MYIPISSASSPMPQQMGHHSPQGPRSDPEEGVREVVLVQYGPEWVAAALAGLDIRAGNIVNMEKVTR